MSTDASDTFADSLAELDVGLTRTPAAEATKALAALTEMPAVGTPLSIDGVALPGGVRTAVDEASVDAAATGITQAAFAIADYGSVVLELTPAGDEPVSLYADTHVAVVRESDVLPDMPAAFERLGETIPAERGSRILATGPSATADMGELVRGAHGPQAVEVVVVTDR
jgi:L-lactate dehydrogenase complex protein LldG